MKRPILTLMLFALLPACATVDPETRQRRIEAAIQGVRTQVNILTPLLDEETAAYVRIAVDAADALLAGGEIDWQAVNAALDRVQPAVQTLLARKMGAQDAALAIAAFRSALSTVQILTAGG